ncbi:MAG: superoxide dismutase [Fe] [Holophagae bacterium]|nr:MAG: superoxide dismutase [Fe] [Holophagae bacterium]
MAFTLPALPYDQDALAPLISPETIEYHYGKHHRAYLDNLNRLSEGTDWAARSLEEIVRRADGALFNNAAQVWNHSFYWNCLSPDEAGGPHGEPARRIAEAFGSVDAFTERFTAAAVGHFGSGWAWLVRRGDGSLAVTSTANADNPLRAGDTPLLTCDVWEHAYYIDYRNARARYVEAFWKLVDWQFVASQLACSERGGMGP